MTTRANDYVKRSLKHCILTKLMYEHENCNPHIKNLGCILQKNLRLSELMNAALSPTKKLVILMV